MSMLLRVNNRFKQQGETNSAFTYQLVSSQAVSSVTSLTLINFSLNRLFTNIHSGNNILVYYDGGLTAYTQTIPLGQYTADELITVLNASTTVIGYTITWSLSNNFFVVNMTGPTPLLLSLASTLGRYIGFENTINLFPGTPVTMPSRPQLQGPDEIFVESIGMANTNCLDNQSVRGGNIPLMSIIPCGNTPYGFTINYTSRQTEQNTVYVDRRVPIQLRTIDIQLTDKFGNLLNLPSNCYADLLFRVTYSE